MKVYFHPTLKEQKTTDTIKRILQRLGHSVQISKKAVKPENETEDIARHDLFILEATNPDAGIGPTVAFALKKNIPVIILYKNESGNKQILPILAADSQAKLMIKEYSLKNLEKHLKEALAEVESFVNSRFTLNLTPQISEFLNWIAEHKKISRSDFVRGLIEAALKKSTKYRKYKKG